MRTCTVLLVSLALLAGLGGAASADEIALGEKAPDFKVKGIDGKEYTLESFKDAKAIVITFTCNNCPVAVAYEDRFIEFAKKTKEKGVAFLAINCNTSENLAAMKQRAEEKGFPFVYAYDETSDSGHKYGARVTPHIFVLDKDRKVAYRGSFDDKQDGPTKSYLADAVAAVIAGKKPELASTKAFGCGIKLKKKEAPKT
jgi:peroxiredoxin